MAGKKATHRRSTQKNPEKAPKHSTYGFGVPYNALAPHHFRVEIPRATRGPSGAVRIIEDLGMHHDHEPALVIDRAVIPRAYWTEVSGALKRTFNERLKAHDLATSTWRSGTNPVDRLLGKELCVLAWALEELDAERVGLALRNWLALRPEERWWLFGRVATSTEGVGDTRCGWRIALRYALGHSQEVPLAKGRRESTHEADETSATLSLFA